MDDQFLFDEFHAAYDFEPRAGSFDRLRVALIDSAVRTGRAGSSLGLTIPGISRRLIAGVAIVAVVLAASGAFIGIWKYAHPVAPAVQPPRACAIQQQFSLACNADDAAVLAASSALEGLGQAKVLITHNGGQTWLTLNLPAFTDSPWMDMRWVDSDHIVVVVGTHLIEVTSDGGVHWHVVTSGWTQGSNLPFFLNANEGWVYAGSGLYHTTDGGLHWINVSPFPSFAQFEYGINRLYFSDSENGFIRQSGLCCPSVPYNQIWVTHDGGRTWAQGSTSSPPPVSDFGNVPQGPFMFGKAGLMAFFSGGDHQGIGTSLSVYKTSDGGVSWSASGSAPGLWLAPLDVNRWWVVDAQGHISRTSDAGNSWYSIKTELANGMTLTSVTPVSKEVLWGYATNGFVAEPLQGGAVKSVPNSLTVRSTDGGVHWSVVNLDGH